MRVPAAAGPSAPVGQGPGTGARSPTTFSIGEGGRVPLLSALAVLVCFVSQLCLSALFLSSPQGCVLERGFHQAKVRYKDELMRTIIQ